MHTAREHVLFGPGHPAPCPVKRKRLELTRTDTFMHPAGVEDELALLARILPEEVLSRFATRVD
jgi:hypothetical protein